MANTVEVPELVASMDDVVEMDGILYFVNSADYSNSLWQWDGTTASKVANSNGTQTETIYSSGSSVSTTSYSLLQAYNGKLYFFATIPEINEATGDELYSYDPETDQFSLVYDFTPGVDNSRAYNFIEYDGKLYFTVRDFSGGYSFWRTDGTTTEEVTVVTNSAVEDFDPLAYAVWKGKLYFRGYDPVSNLYTYDSKTNSITQISDNTSSSHDPYHFLTPDDSDDYLYYSGELNSSSYHFLFRTDGTSVEVLDENIVVAQRAIKVGTTLYFEGDDGTAGDEVYKLDLNTLSVSEVQIQGIAPAYPVPATNQITVDPSLVNATYSIFDVTGKVVKNGVLKSRVIDFNLNSGLYILKAQTDSGFYAQKIIVK
ncbi:T9SS type A sorting domain-containing protein [Formosa haliotis]|uniref:T9SS type A sorting domain-containing protein n=1 Tax=Formosa haliotis TaxID=1555194 RepID=UPI000825636C|nr:T9SS type A sorting domain-containing protein [Formosa haliotis]